MKRLSLEVKRLGQHCIIGSEFRLLTSGFHVLLLLEFQELFAGSRRDARFFSDVLKTRGMHGRSEPVTHLLSCLASIHPAHLESCAGQAQAAGMRVQACLGVLVTAR